MTDVCLSSSCLTCQGQPGLLAAPPPHPRENVLRLAGVFLVRVVGAGVVHEQVPRGQEGVLPARLVLREDLDGGPLLVHPGGDNDVGADVGGRDDAAEDGGSALDRDGVRHRDGVVLVHH